MTQRDWARELTHRIASEVKRLRSQQQATAQQLSDRTAELGHRISRSRISDLERGDRGAPLGVAELLVLAKALSVPPVQLLVTLGRQATIEVLPGAEMGAWEAAKWMSGEGPWLRKMNDGGWTADADDWAAWERSAPLMFRRLDDLYPEWREARVNVSRAKYKVDAAQSTKEQADAQELLEAREQLVRSAEDKIRNHREAMRRRGIDPGPLLPEFAHIDEPADD